MSCRLAALFTSRYAWFTIYFSTIIPENNNIRIINFSNMNLKTLKKIQLLIEKLRKVEIIYVNEYDYDFVMDILQDLEYNPEVIVLKNTTLLPQKGLSLETYSWDEIATISEAGEAENYFVIGDEKTVEINGTSYIFEIIGFNHDDLADGSGKAGITFETKNLIFSNTINSTHTNVGGWEESKIREYVNEDVYALLPSDLQEVIKIVNKKTSAGNTLSEIITSQDKIFLLSTIEVLGETGYSKAGEGEQYAYYVNGGSKIKQRVNDANSDKWWTRSPNGGVNFAFATIDSSGKSSSNEAASSNTFIFAFCI